MILLKYYVTVGLPFSIQLLCAGCTITGHYLNYYGGNSDAHIARVGESLKLTSKSTVDGVFYRAIGSHGLTLDFDLRKHRDYQSAYHFLRRLLTTYG